MNKHKLNDKKAKRLYLLFATTAMMIMVFCTAVFAETDPLAVVNNLSRLYFQPDSCHWSDPAGLRHSANWPCAEIS